MKNNIMPWLIILAIALIAAGTSVYLFGEKRTINVQGVSEFDVKPDKIDIFFNVITNATTAKEAQEENSLIVERVITSLKQAGIDEDKIQTLNFNMGPRQYWDPATQRMVQDGYQVSHNIKIEVSDMLKAGNYIDIATIAGATGIDYINIGLTQEKENEAKQKALELAAANAKSKAEGIAAGLGMKLGKLKAVSESNYYYSPYMRTFAQESIPMVKEAIADTIISTGTLKVNGNVDVVYELR